MLKDEGTPTPPRVRGQRTGWKRSWYDFPMEKRWLAGLVAMTMFVASCTQTSTATTQIYGSADPLTVREEWDRLGIVDYRLVYSIRNINGMGGSPGDGLYSFVVRDGDVTECGFESSQPSGYDACVALSQIGPGWSPIETLFARLVSSDPAFFTVEYHATLPLPVRIDYDDPATADEEYEIRVIEFQTTNDES